MNKNTNSQYDTYKSDDQDTFVSQRFLQGEGLWHEAMTFEAPNGDQYEVWVDQDGGDKIIEL